jgi:hypothetical protein
MQTQMNAGVADQHTPNVLCRVVCSCCFMGYLLTRKASIRKEHGPERLLMGLRIDWYLRKIPPLRHEFRQLAELIALRHFSLLEVVGCWAESLSSQTTKNRRGPGPGMEIREARKSVHKLMIRVRNFRMVVMCTSPSSSASDVECRDEHRSIHFTGQLMGTPERSSLWVMGHMN